MAAIMNSLEMDLPAKLKVLQDYLANPVGNPEPMRVWARQHLANLDEQILDHVNAHDPQIIQITHPDRSVEQLPIKIIQGQTRVSDVMTAITGRLRMPDLVMTDPHGVEFKGPSQLIWPVGGERPMAVFVYDGKSTYLPPTVMMRIQHPKGSKVVNVVPGVTTIADLLARVAPDVGVPDYQLQMMVGGRKLSPMAIASNYQTEADTSFTAIIQERAPFQTFARLPTGRSLLVTIEPSLRGADLTAQIAREMGADPANLRLLVSGQEIAPNQYVVNYPGIEEMIHVIGSSGSAPSKREIRLALPTGGETVVPYTEGVTTIGDIIAAAAPKISMDPSHLRAIIGGRELPRSQVVSTYSRDDLSAIQIHPLAGLVVPTMIRFVKADQTELKIPFTFTATTTVQDVITHLQSAGLTSGSKLYVYNENNDRLTSLTDRVSIRGGASKTVIVTEY